MTHDFRHLQLNHVKSNIETTKASILKYESANIDTNHPTMMQKCVNFLKAKWFSVFLFFVSFQLLV